MKLPTSLISASVTQWYERSARRLRWACLALVALTYPFDQAPPALVVLTLLTIVSIYNLLLGIKAFRRQAFFSSRLNGLAADHIFVLTLVALSGGLASPYYPFFFLLVIAIIASYGITGFTIALSSQILITILLQLVPNTPIPAHASGQFTAQLASVIIFCLVAEQSVRNRNDEQLIETRTTKRLDSERQRLLALINALSNAVFAVDHAGKVSLYNGAARELLGSDHRVEGAAIGELLTLHDDKYASFDLMAYLRKLKTATNRQDLVLVPSDGSEMKVDLTISPMPTVRGEKAGGAIIVLRDITKQKSLDEQRDEFISVASHELRTPLAIAEANLSTALLPGYAKIDDKAKPLLEQTHENLVFLSALIQDLTTLSRAERGAIELEESIVNLPKLLDEMTRDYRAQAEAKGLNLVSVLDQNTHQVYTSPSELREIVQNFLTNAIKYTPSGTVTLRLEHTPQAAIISVQDTGIGISASDKTKIFEKFFRSEDYRTRATGGTGLGLYITRKLAERLGAEIDFTSRLNNGSTFSLKIPYAKVDL